MKFDPEFYTIIIRKEEVDGNVRYAGRVIEFPNISVFEDSFEAARTLVLNSIQTLKNIADETQADFPLPYQKIDGLVLRKKPRYTLAELLAEMPPVGEDTDFPRVHVEWDTSPAVGKEMLERVRMGEALAALGCKIGLDTSISDSDDELINFMLDQLNDSINRTSTAIDNSLEFVDSSKKRIELLEQSQEADVDEVELKKCVVMLIKETAEARQELIEALKEVDTTVIELRQRAAKRKEIDDW